MEIDHKKIDLVPFTRQATTIDAGCPFFVGHGSRFTRKDKRIWKEWQRYCMGMRAVATYCHYNKEIILNGCCC